MSEFVHLLLKRHRGWPWPVDRSGAALAPMFGEHGWCHSCGVPKHPQTGSIILQRRGLKVEGAWKPNGHFDAICLEASVAERAAACFALELRKVDWHPTAPPKEAWQIVVPTIGGQWFNHDELREKAIERHGWDGARCPDCGVWRWTPLVFRMLPPLRITPPLPDNIDVAASPEWFGDGWLAFRQILIRRPLAELIATASPKDFEVRDVSWG